MFDIPLNYYNLPQELKKEVKDFIDFLLTKYKNVSPENQDDLAAKRKANFGNAAGMVRISPDFDEPLEGFEDYM